MDVEAQSTIRSPEVWATRLPVSKIEHQLKFTNDRYSPGLKG